MELWRRDGEGWSNTIVAEPAAVELASLGLALSLDEIYFDPLAS